MRKLPTDHRADLGDFLGLTEAIQTFRKRGLQGGGDGRVRDVETAFDQRLSQFLDEQRHPVGSLDDAHDHVIRYIGAGNHADDVGAVRLAQAVQL